MKRFYRNQGRNNEELESGLKSPCWDSSCQDYADKNHESKERPYYKTDNKLDDISQYPFYKGEGVAIDYQHQAVYVAWVGHPSLIC